MNGQWIGTYTATNATATNHGTLVVDLDDEGDHYGGSAAAINNDPTLPPMLAELPNVPKGQNEFEIQLRLRPINPEVGLPVQWDQIKTHFQPDVTVPTCANVKWKLNGETIELSWTTDIGSSGRSTVTKSHSASPSELEPLAGVKTWEEFRQFANQLDAYRYIFRGQPSNKWRLRTSFHRTGRASLLKFMIQDIPILHRQLSGMMAHHLDLRDPLHNAAFYSLVQHHGYPTPLLDWTYSPFIAAFFAYRSVRAQENREHRVRIFVFDKLHWEREFERVSLVNAPKLHFTVLEPLALNNPRVVPQQSVSSVTNLDDIETYLRSREAQFDRNYLRAIDLPASERGQIMHELSLMGITAGSLFPGIEGACEQIRHRFFDL
jgi:hypothetical protein